MEGWVIQHEGWLFKRGAGYHGERDENDNDNEEMPKSSRRKTLVLKGKGEKKRYFVLFTKESRGDSPPSAELHYYTTKPVKLGKKAAKGVISLKPGMKVVLVEDSMLQLITKDRTYYLRPEGEKSGAKARLAAGQWESAIQFALDGLSAFERMQNDPKDGTHPMNRISLRQQKNRAGLGETVKTTLKRLKSVGQSLGLVGVDDDGDDIELEDENDDLDFQIGADEDMSIVLAQATLKAKKSNNNNSTDLLFGLGADEESGQFASIWSNSGLDGYNALVAHFGPVMIDLRRMELHIANRIKQLSVQMETLESFNAKSHEPVLREQKTTREALREIYGEEIKRSDRLSKCVQDVIENSLEPIRGLIKELENNLDSIVQYHKSATDEIARLRKTVLATAKDENLLSRMLNGARQEEAGGADKKPRKRKSLLQLRSQLSNPDLPIEDLETQLGAARQLRREQETALVKCETKHTVQMISAMDALESLERRRLDQQQSALIFLATREKDLVQELYTILSNSSALFTAVVNIDPQVDIRLTSDALLRQAQIKNK